MSQRPQAAGPRCPTTPVTSPVNATNGASASKANGKVTFNPLAVTKKMDKASPVLFQ